MSVPDSAASTSTTSLLFAPVDVPDNHWAVTPLFSTDDHFVYHCVVNGRFTLQVKLNPTDSRAYRSIVFLMDPKNPRATLNRKYTLEERMALHTVLALTASVYESLGLIAQVEVAGNNSHSFDTSTGVTTVGKLEPSFLHGHVLGRGNPQASYIANVPLRGPAPGELFNMREGKTKWSADEQVLVARRLRQSMDEVHAASKLSSVVLGPSPADGMYYGRL